MSQPAIAIRDLKKEFLLSHSGVGSLKTMFLWWKRPQIEHLRVLNGVTFNVAKGESVAVVGKNGAGKSTLLSLVARVYKPTSGAVEINGRVAPLLELGAGFHPDLTGIENVFFNGVILGLTRKEIKERLPAIVDFAGLHHHIDAPVRTYSSGMMARLGFACAVHVDAEILLVDEVLAVGDYEFEQKCYATIDAFRASGGSILFVSHSMEAVRRVADRVIWLKGGLIQAEGAPNEVIAAYEADGRPVPETA
ncbi:MAG TPA: ABC transporter ATP-binding protein [Fimbriimonadaceae bacterium]|nr:ABC transporter ATP-binding protein [Fimbriimonadaceae bacterium]